MGYLNDPLIPFNQQAPSAAFNRIDASSGIDPTTLSELHTYFNANTPNSLFQDTGGLTAATTTGQPVKFWKELENSAGVNDAIEATNNPTLLIEGGMNKVAFDGSQYLTLATSAALFNFMHNGDGGEVIIVGEINTGGGTNHGILSTNGTLSANIGFTVGHVTLGGKRFWMNVSSAGAGAQAWTQYWFNDVDTVLDEEHTFQMAYKDDDIPPVVLELDNQDARKNSSAHDNDPVATNATLDLAIGWAGLSNTWMSGNLSAIAIFNPPLDEVTREGVAEFLALESGLDVSNDIEVYPPETGYTDFDINNTELSYTHPNLPYCTTHSIAALASGVEVTVTFYAGDNLSKVEKLTDTGVDYNVSGVTRIGFKTETVDQTAIGRSWSR